MKGLEVMNLSAKEVGTSIYTLRGPHGLPGDHALGTEANSQYHLFHAGVAWENRAWK